MTRFEFVAMGTHQPHAVPGKLFLDVGNSLQTGVLDHHQGEEPGCAARLVVEHPELVTDWIPVGTEDYTVVLHSPPDLDCVAATYLARHLITHGDLPAGAELLAAYTCEIDQGRIERPDPDNPRIYEIFEIIRSRISYGPETNRETLDAGLELLDFALGRLAERDAPDSLDGLFTGAHPYESAVTELVEDKKKYERDLSDPDQVLPISLYLPKKKTGIPVLKDGLIYRDPSARHFKLWARTDRINAPQEDGFTFTNVIWTGAIGEAQKRDRFVLSVDPCSDVDLRHLGDVLNAAERDAVAAAGLELEGPPRPGYESFGLADPWYDGRAHDFTIVDTPRRGTELDASAIEQCLYAFMDLHTFQTMAAPRAHLRLLFNLTLPTTGEPAPPAVIAALEAQGWHRLQDDSEELSPAFRQFLFGGRDARRPFVLMEKAVAPEGESRYPVSRVALALYPRGIAVVTLEVDSTRAVPEALFTLNAQLRHGLPLSRIAGPLVAPVEAELAALRQAGLEPAQAKLTFKLCFVQLKDTHKSRDKAFFGRLLATFIGEKRAPVAIQQSDIDAAESGQVLGRYGRLVVLPRGAFLLTNKVDIEMPEREQRQLEELFLDAGWYVALNACLQKGMVEALMQELARSADEDFESRRLSKRLQYLQERVMELATRSVNHNPGTSTFTNGLWEGISRVMRLPDRRTTLNQSVNELADYVDTRRKASIDRILFVLSLAIGPLTLLTDYMGAVLGEVYPGPAGFLSVLGVTYALAVVGFSGFVLASRIKRS